MPTVLIVINVVLVMIGRPAAGLVWRRWGSGAELHQGSVLHGLVTQLDVERVAGRLARSVKRITDPRLEPGESAYRRRHRAAVTPAAPAWRGIDRPDPGTPAITGSSRPATSAPRPPPTASAARPASRLPTTWPGESCTPASAAKAENQRRHQRLVGSDRDPGRPARHGLWPDEAAEPVQPLPLVNAARHTCPPLPGPAKRDDVGFRSVDPSRPDTAVGQCRGERNG